MVQQAFLVVLVMLVHLVLVFEIVLLEVASAKVYACDRQCVGRPLVVEDKNTLLGG